MSGGLDHQPDNDLEFALLMPLTPENFTAIIRDKNDATGVASIQACNLH